MESVRRNGGRSTINVKNTGSRTKTGSGIRARADALYFTGVGALYLEGVYKLPRNRWLPDSYK